MAGTMIIVNIKDGVCLTYYIGPLQVYHVSGRVQLKVIANSMYNLTYFRSYKLTMGMWTDPVLRPSAMEPCMKADWNKNAKKNGFVR